MQFSVLSPALVQSSENSNSLRGGGDVQVMMAIKVCTAQPSAYLHNPSVAVGLDLYSL